MCEVLPVAMMEWNNLLLFYFCLLRNPMSRGQSWKTWVSLLEAKRSAAILENGRKTQDRLSVQNSSKHWLP